MFLSPILVFRSNIVVEMQGIVPDHGLLPEIGPTALMEKHQIKLSLLNNCTLDAVAFS